MNRILRLLVIINILIVGIAGISAVLYFMMKQSEQWVAHTQEVLYVQSDLYSNFQDMNLASRGYAFTGNTAMLKPHKDGKAALAKNLSQLGALTQDNEKEKVDTNNLVRDAKSFDDVTNNLISTRSAELVEPQKISMDRLRNSLNDIVREEKRMLIERQRESNLNYLLGALALASQGILGIGILGVCTQTLKTYSKENQIKLEALEAEIENRKKTELALRDATVKLTNSNNDLQQFAYVASHDLQEPLRAVVGFLTLLDRRLKGMLEPDAQEWLQHAVDGGQRMRTLVNDLLSYSRVDSQGEPTGEVDLNEVIQAALTNLSASIEEAEATVNLHSAPTVIGDKAQLTQLFQNLIGNAIKYKSLERKPVIDINAVEESGKWTFTIKDNGLGFDMQHAKRIFVIFQRLHSRGKHPGTGIGLALCKRIIERHEGEIWCDSQVNAGSTFLFTLHAKEN